MNHLDVLHHYPLDFLTVIDDTRQSYGLTDNASIPIIQEHCDFVKEVAMAQQTPLRQEQAQGDRVETKAVTSARTVLSDVVEASGDLANTAVRTVCGVGHEVIHGVGSLGNDAVVEASRLFVSLATGVRNTFGSIVSGRSEPADSQQDQPRR